MKTDNQFWDEILSRYFKFCNVKDTLQKPIKRKRYFTKSKLKTMYKYYVLSLKNKHALGVIEETETTMTVQKLKVDKVFNKFSNSYQDEIVPDFSHEQVNNAILPKGDLSEQLETVEITKDYWKVFEYLTGRKRKAVADNSEC